ncbi:MAG: magnesium transporter [Candidatus Omnitrophota bacterium]|nr:MAG: magnesium transporter [Candidatus Omnitrophota bacterium]
MDKKIRKDSVNLKSLMQHLLAEKNFLQAKAFLTEIPAIDIAEIWPDFLDKEKILLFKLLEINLAVELFESLKFEEQSFLLDNLDNVDVSHVLNEMAPDERANLFKDLPPKVIKKFFRLMKKEEVEDVQELMSYEEGTAGAIMTTDFVELRKEMSSREAILKLQDSLSFDIDLDISSIYITALEHKLVGVVELQDLIKSPPEMLIKNIMENVDIIRTDIYARDEDVAKVFKRYDLISAPVVNEFNQLKGIITIDDIVDIIEKEATRDMYEVGKMTSAEGEIISYATATVKELVSRRAGWLMFLLVFDFLTGRILKTYQHSLSLVVPLVFFIPMLLDTGGNAGAQTSITVIRGLATGDVNFDTNVKKVIKLELIGALVMGIFVGVVAFVRAILLQVDVLIGLVVAITMFLVVVLAICTGMFLPLISKKIGMDPAVLAGPITTSVVDIIGLIIYFKIAHLILPVLQ